MPKKKKDSAVKAAPKQSKPSNGIVTYRMTYLWSEMNTNSSVLKIVTQGMVVEILEELPNDWSKVRTVEEKPVTGYIRSVFVEKPEG